MKINSRDMQILEHIVQYCYEVELTIKRFGKNQSCFEKDPIYLNAVSMPILQIGELAKHLSNDFIKYHADIPWRAIKGMRDFFAHQYHSMDKEIIWNVAIEKVPNLKIQCQKILSDMESK